MVNREKKIAYIAEEKESELVEIVVEKLNVYLVSEKLKEKKSEKK